MQLDKYYGPLLKPFGDLSKPVKIIDEKHLDFIRQQPCVMTGRMADEGSAIVAHHVQKKSQIRNDYMTIPLFAPNHTDFHNDESRYEAVNNVDFKDALIAKLVERVYDLTEQLKEAKDG